MAAFDEGYRKKPPWERPGGANYFVGMGMPEDACSGLSGLSS